MDFMNETLVFIILVHEQISVDDSIFHDEQARADISLKIPAFQTIRETLVQTIDILSFIAQCKIFHIIAIEAKSNDPFKWSD